MKKVLVSPSMYIQGNGELEKLGQYTEKLGNKAMLIAHKDDYTRVQNSLDISFKNKEIVNIDFCGECTKNEIKRISEIARTEKCNVIIGLGGGKAIDTAKAVAILEIGVPIVVVPTIASTDAPCSSLAVAYTDEGEFDEYLMFGQNPNIVLVDTGIIAKAPTRFLVAGMGDALATKFEARACQRSNANNIPNGKSTILAIAASNACYDTLIEDGLKAKYACDTNVVTKSLENIVEANILLSGMGFESSGLAGAHAIHNGLTALEETHQFFHGEKVSFGTIVQLVLENAPKKELEEVINFCKSVGLPTCLKELGVTKINHEKIMNVAKISCDDKDTMGNMPFEVEAVDVYSAILVADKIGG